MIEAMQMTVSSAMAKRIDENSSTAGAQRVRAASEAKAVGGDGHGVAAEGRNGQRAGHPRWIGPPLLGSFVGRLVHAIRPEQVQRKPAM